MTTNQFYVSGNIEKRPVTDKPQSGFLYSHSTGFDKPVTIRLQSLSNH
nr:MAG TPA: hypothetical protein [Caudoviricetes sp.]